MPDGCKRYPFQLLNRLGMGLPIVLGSYLKIHEYENWHGIRLRSFKPIKLFESFFKKYVQNGVSKLLPSYAQAKNKKSLRF